MRRTAVVTVIAKNYLAQARTLMQSVRAHHPECERIVLLSDRVDDAFDPAEEDFAVWSSQHLAMPGQRIFHLKYNVLELATALKPRFFSHVFERTGAERLVFLDPDTLLFDRLEPALAALERDSILLTPHLTAPLGDAAIPDEHNWLRIGAYNLGFLALRRGPEAEAFLVWMRRKLHNDCVNDPAIGLCADQRWADLVPGMFEGVGILRDPGLNVAHWNLPHRPIENRDGRYHAAGVPLRLFHFSGFRPENTDVLCHYPQTRYTRRTLGGAGPLYDLYERRLYENGYGECRQWAYAYDFLSDGTRLPEVARRILRDDTAFQATVQQMPDEEADRRIVEYLNGASERAASPSRLVTRLLERLYQIRPDVQRAFPNGLEHDKTRLARWFLDYGAREHAIGGIFVAPVAHALEAEP